MTGRVRKWGNSAAVRIPSAILAEAGLTLDQAVDVREERGRIVIEDARRRRFRIGDLVRAISSENLHDAIDTGLPLGREVW